MRLMRESSGLPSYDWWGPEGRSAPVWPPAESQEDRLAKATLQHFMDLGGAGVGDGYIAQKIFPSSAPGDLPEGVTGWHVYRQGPDGKLYQQNIEPLPLDQATYTVETHVIHNPHMQEPGWEPEPVMSPRDWRVAHMFLSIARHRRYGYPIEDQMGRLHELDAWARERGDVDLIVRVGRLRERLRRRFERISTNAPRPSPARKSYLEVAASWHGFDLPEPAYPGNTQLTAATGAADALLGVIKQNVEVVADTAKDLWVQITADVQPALDGIAEIGSKLTALIDKHAGINRSGAWPEDNLAECRVRHLHVVKRNISPRTIARERLWVPPTHRLDPLLTEISTRYHHQQYVADWGPGGNDTAHFDHVHLTC